jgi:hypothetical protein
MNLVHPLQFVPGFFVQDAAELDPPLEVWIRSELTTQYV